MSTVTVSRKMCMALERSFSDDLLHVMQNKSLKELDEYLNSFESADRGADSVVNSEMVLTLLMAFLKMVFGNNEVRISKVEVWPGETIQVYLNAADAETEKAFKQKFEDTTPSIIITDKVLNGNLNDFMVAAASWRVDIFGY